MTKAQLKKAIDREVRGMRSRIADIVKNRIADQIIDDGKHEPIICKNSSRYSHFSILGIKWEYHDNS